MGACDKVKRIKPFNSSLNNGHYEFEEVLKESTMDTSRHEYKVKWVGYTNEKL